MSLLSSLFCCWGSRRATDGQSEPDERTRLLPTADDPAASPRHVVDQERMKERLGVIVRAKEGKMVNLQAPLPFNLRNARSVSLQPSLDDDEASQSASSSGAPDDEPQIQTRAPLAVRLVRAAPALRGRTSVRRISPSSLAKCDDAEPAEEAGAIENGQESETGNAEPGPSTALAFTIQPVGSFSRSWGD